MKVGIIGLGKMGAMLLSKLSMEKKEVFTIEDARLALSMPATHLRKLLFDLTKNKQQQRHRL